MSIVGGGL